VFHLLMASYSIRRFNSIHYTYAIRSWIPSPIHSGWILSNYSLVNPPEKSPYAYLGSILQVLAILGDSRVN